MQLDPYELLGVPRDATQAMIRKAYRTLARTAHPDGGGDPARWDELQLAYNVLFDPDLRAHYDATGEVDRKRADNALAEELAFLSVALQNAIERLQRGQAPIECLDMVGVLKAQVIHDRAERALEIAHAQRTVRALKGRFVLTDPGQPVDRLARIVESLERDAAELVARAQKLDQLADKALAVLERYTFRVDRRAPPGLMPGFWKGQGPFA